MQQLRFSIQVFNFLVDAEMNCCLVCSLALLVVAIDTDIDVFRGESSLSADFVIPNTQLLHLVGLISPVFTQFQIFVLYQTVVYCLIFFSLIPIYCLILTYCSYCTFQLSTRYLHPPPVQTVHDSPSITKLSFRAALLFALIFLPSFFPVPLSLLQCRIT